MSKLLYGSICLTDVIELAKAKNGAVTKGKNGKLYVNVNVWINDEQDNYGNIAGIQTTFKDASKEDKKYIGNLKESVFTTPTVEASDVSGFDDLGF